MSIRALLLGLGLASAGLPATATGATWTVDPQKPDTGSCDPQSHVCKTITQAASAAGGGDTIEVRDGDYAEPPITLPQANLTLRAQNRAGAHLISAGGNAGDPVITLTGSGATVEGLVIDAPPAGGPAILAQASNPVLRFNTLRHLEASGASAADTPVVDVTATTGTAQLAGDVIEQRNGTVGAVRATSVLAVADTRVVTTKGYALRFEGGTDAANINTLIRSRVVTTAATGNAVEVASGSANDTMQVRIDSSILSGGDSGTGLIAQSPKFVDANSQPITVTAALATVAGSTTAVVADAEPAALQIGTLPGAIHVAFNHSIVHGAAQARSGSNAMGAQSIARIDIVSSDTDIKPAANVTAANNSNTPIARLLIDLAHDNLHLRGDAPVIDKGGQPAAGDSTTDVDSDPRVVGPASDLGADEFVNRVPVARVKTAHATVSEKVSVTFSGSASTDPDAGDRIAWYRWDFGDGKQTTTQSASVSHTYSRSGSYTVSLRVVDIHNAISEPATIGLRVKDNKRPSISIRAPAGKNVLSSRTRLTISGRTSDANGVRHVRLSIRFVQRSKSRAGRASASRCRYFTGHRFVTKRCGRRIWLRARLSKGVWRYRVPRSLRLAPGRYEIKARATDKKGLRSRTAIRHFRVR
jgi:PKD repeat protein